MPAVFSKEVKPPFTFNKILYRAEINRLSETLSLQDLFKYLLTAEQEYIPFHAENEITTPILLKPRIIQLAELLSNQLQKLQLLRLKKGDFIRNRKCLEVQQTNKIEDLIKHQQAILMQNLNAIQFDSYYLLRHWQSNDNSYLINSVLQLLKMIFDELEGHNKNNKFFCKKILNKNIAQLNIFLCFNWYKKILDPIINRNFYSEDFCKPTILTISKENFSIMQELFDSSAIKIPYHPATSYHAAYHFILKCYQFKTLAQHYIQFNDKKSLSKLKMTLEAGFAFNKIEQIKNQQYIFNDYITIEAIKEYSSLPGIIIIILYNLWEKGLEQADNQHLIALVFTVYQNVLDELLRFYLEKEQKISEQLAENPKNKLLMLYRSQFHDNIVSIIALQNSHQESLEQQSPLTQTVNTPKDHEQSISSTSKLANSSKKLLKNLKKHQQHLIRLGIDNNKSPTNPSFNKTINRGGIIFNKILNHAGDWYAAVDPEILNNESEVIAKKIKDFFEYPKYAQKKWGVQGIKPIADTERLNGHIISDRYQYKLKFIGKQGLGDQRLLAEEFIDKQVESIQHFLFFKAKASHNKIIYETRQSVAALQQAPS